MEPIRQALAALQKGDANAFSEIRIEYEALLNSMVGDCLHIYRYDAEFDDLMQEATLALYKAAEHFDLTQSEVTFGLYAKICIRNRLISLGRKLLHHKKIRETIDSTKLSGSVEKRSAEFAQFGELPQVIDAFSDFEKSVFTLYLQGCSYKEMAQQLDKNEKSIDNAICRIKSKLKKLVMQGGVPIRIGNK